MIKAADSYGRALYELGLPREDLEVCRSLLQQNPDLAGALQSPAVTQEEKHRVIDRLFPISARGFLKALCDDGAMESFPRIEEICEALRMEKERMIEADLIYFSRPSEAQIQALKEMIKKKYDMAGVVLREKREPDLAGGFILRIGDQEYDQSVRGRLERLRRRLAWG